MNYIQRKDIVMALANYFEIDAEDDVIEEIVLSRLEDAEDGLGVITEALSDWGCQV